MSSDYKPGERVYRYVWAGGSDSDINILTVVRVNRKTITCLNALGETVRVSHADIVGRVDWE